MYKILTGTVKDIERELNRIHKSNKRLQVLIMNSYNLSDDEPRLIVLTYIGN